MDREEESFCVSMGANDGEWSQWSEREEDPESTTAAADCFVSAYLASRYWMSAGSAKPEPLRMEDRVCMAK